MDPQVNLEIIKAALTTVSTFIVAGGATLLWQIRQRKRETQLEALKQFYDAYGRFVTTWKLWNHALYRYTNKETTADEFNRRQSELLERAAEAEAKTEGILLKIASETKIDERTAKQLGGFRQAFKQLRKCIRKGNELPYGTSESKPYIAFKRLSCHTASVLGSPWSWKAPRASEAIVAFQTISSSDRERDWIDIGTA